MGGDLSGQDNDAPTPPNQTQKEAKVAGENEDEDSSLGATLGLILIAILICVGIGIGVYFGVAAILNSVKKNRIGTDTSNSTNLNQTDLAANKVNNETALTTTIELTTTTTTSLQRRPRTDCHQTCTNVT